MKIAAVETGHRIQLPADWAAELGMDETVALEKTSEGILVRPVATWDEVFAKKLSIGQQSAALDFPEVSGDDVLL